MCVASGYSLYYILRKQEDREDEDGQVIVGDLPAHDLSRRDDFLETGQIVNTVTDRNSHPPSIQRPEENTLPFIPAVYAPADVPGTPWPTGTMTTAATTASYASN